jgi:(Z)-2-((N-methylformamido)methylene)-5-hydroxybutyrolactone dehydrogenase
MQLIETPKAKETREYRITGQALVRHTGVDKVAFTGSTETGKQVMKDAADHLAKVTLELGGKSPNIVFDDADLEAAANGVVSGIFAATGQTCMAGSRLFVHEDLHDELVGALAEKAKAPTSSVTPWR